MGTFIDSFPLRSNGSMTTDSTTRVPLPQRAIMYSLVIYCRSSTLVTQCVDTFFSVTIMQTTQDPWLSLLDSASLREHHDKLAHAYAQFCRLVEEKPSMPQSRSSQFFDGKTVSFFPQMYSLCSRQWLVNAPT